MQCVNVVQKRSRDAEAEPWSCRAVSGAQKRVCLEVELQVTDCPMETSHSFQASSQQLDQQVRPRPAQCCPRCLRGEPGHFSHIMGH